MSKRVKRLFSMILALTMLISLLPTSAISFAAGEIVVYNSVLPHADGSARANSTTEINGGGTTLNINYVLANNAQTGNATRWGYMRFDLTPYTDPIVSAKLTLQARMKYQTGSGLPTADMPERVPYGIVEIYPVNEYVTFGTTLANVPWVEGSGIFYNTASQPYDKDTVPYLCWAQKPAISGARIATVSRIPLSSTTYSTYEVDLTTYLSQRQAEGKSTATILLREPLNIFSEIRDTNAVNIDIATKEDTTPGNRPSLVVSTQQGAESILGNNNADLSYLTSGTAGSASEINAKFNQFDPAVSGVQTFALPEQDLPITINAYAADANTSIAINGTTATKGSASVAITPAEFTNNGGTREKELVILTTAQDKTTIKTYHIKLTLPSSDATLSDLTCDGVTVANFDSNTKDYYVSLPKGTTQIPVIGATANHSEAAVAITQALSIPGDATVVATAENGTMQTYTVHFDFVSPDTSLGSLAYLHPEMGKQEISVVSNTTDYSVTLPFGISNAVPQVEATAGNPASVVQPIIQAESIPGMAQVIVTAADGSETVYHVSFSISQMPPEPGVGMVTGLKHRGENAVEPFMAVTGLQATEPVNIYGDDLAYPTQADKVSASINPDVNSYKNDDLRVYSDRTPSTGGGNGSAANQAIGSQMEFSYVVSGDKATSQKFVSPNVTKILTMNNEKNYTDSVPDLYSFTIDKPATIFIATNNSNLANVMQYGWDLDPTGLQVARSKYTIMQYTEGAGADQLYYAIPDGSYNIYSSIYKKHYAAGANVEVPSAGAAASAMVILVVWDTVLERITSVSLDTLSELNQTYGATKPVAFHAVSVQSENVDYSTLSWYVNDVDQGHMGKDFIFTPTEVGDYVVTVKVSDCEYVTVETQTIHVDYAYGDVSGDGSIDVSDVIMTAEIAVGFGDYTSDQVRRANVSSKEDMTVDISDVVMIAERAVGSEALFPVDE